MDTYEQTCELADKARRDATTNLCRVEFRIVRAAFEYESALQAYHSAEKNFQAEEERNSYLHVAFDNAKASKGKAQAKYDGILSNLGPEPHLIDQTKLAEIKQAWEDFSQALGWHKQACEALTFSDILLETLRAAFAATNGPCEAAECKHREAKAELATAEEEVAKTNKAYTVAISQR